MAPKAIVATRPPPKRNSAASEAAADPPPVAAAEEAPAQQQPTAEASTKVSTPPAVQAEVSTPPQATPPSDDAAPPAAPTAAKSTKRVAVVAPRPAPKRTNSMSSSQSAPPPTVASNPPTTEAAAAAPEEAPSAPEPSTPPQAAPPSDAPPVEEKREDVAATQDVAEVPQPESAVDEERQRRDLALPANHEDLARVSRRRVSFVHRGGRRLRLSPFVTPALHFGLCRSLALQSLNLGCGLAHDDVQRIIENATDGTAAVADDEARNEAALKIQCAQRQKVARERVRDRRLSQAKRRAVADEASADQEDAASASLSPEDRALVAGSPSKAAPAEEVTETTEEEPAKEPSAKEKADAAAKASAAARAPPAKPAAKVKLAPRPPVAPKKTPTEPQSSRAAAPAPRPTQDRPNSAPVPAHNNGAESSTFVTEDTTPPPEPAYEEPPQEEANAPSTPPAAIPPPEATPAGDDEDPPTEGRAMTSDGASNAPPVACASDLGRSFGKSLVLDNRSPKKYAYEPLFAQKRPEHPPAPSDPYKHATPLPVVVPPTRKVRVTDDPVISALEQTLAARRAEARRKQAIVEARSAELQRKMEEEQARRVEETHARRMEELRRQREAQEERMRFYEELQKARLDRLSKHIKIDPDVVTGKKSITDVFNERRAETAKREAEERERALHQRHKQCATGKEFYEHLSEHEKMVLQRKQQEEAERMNRKSEVTTLPVLPKEYRTKARAEVLAAEEEERQRMIHAKRLAMEKRQAQLEYAEEIKRKKEGRERKQSAASSAATPAPAPPPAPHAEEKEAAAAAAAAADEPEKKKKRKKAKVAKPEPTDDNGDATAEAPPPSSDPAPVEVVA